jgi:hypothetical protein
VRGAANFGRYLLSRAAERSSPTVSSWLRTVGVAEARVFSRLSNELFLNRFHEGGETYADNGGNEDNQAETEPIPPGPHPSNLTISFYRFSRLIL